MTPQQIALVRSSFALALPVSNEVAADFYRRLFVIAPHVRPLFSTDIAEQGRKLMLTLASIVADLDRLDVLVPRAVELARRHVAYGARDEHYDAVGTALIETLRDRLGARFTPEVEAAWAAAYGTLADAMIAGVRQAA